ncbi:ompa/motb domain protein [Flammeovirgaceae bacterium 311]|nr:ompa/motb domain protein [Flammeovirgaceae bacterium 311]
MPEQINSDYIEIRPFITGDGKTLYFGRREHPDNNKGEKDLQDIYVVRREGTGWGEPENLGEPINNRFSNSLFGISPEGDELLMLNTYKKVDGPLARFKKQNGKWVDPESVVIEDFHNYSEYLDFFQNYTEDVLLMALEREDSRGEQDIYVSFPKEDGSWSKPLNLGPGVNTKKSEFAPFMAPDGRTLFFCSYGLKGRGGADIYYVQRLDETWIKWSSPVNLGEPINSSGEETFFSVTDDARDIYYVSYRHGSEKRDIYKSPLLPRIELLPPMPTHKSLVAINRNIRTVQTQVPNTEAVAAADDTFTDTEDAAMTAAANDFPEEREGESMNATGAVTVGQPDQSAESTGTQELQSGITVQAQNGTTPLAGIEIRHKEVASDIPDMQQFSILRNIYYDFNQTSLRKGAYETIIQNVIRFLNENPSAKLKVVGHADEMGTKKANLEVSQRRAQLLKKHLVEQGVAAERILVHFRGEEEPLASNDDDREGRELNRRAEFFVLMPAAGK